MVVLLDALLLLLLPKRFTRKGSTGAAAGGIYVFAAFQEVKPAFLQATPCQYTKGINTCLFVSPVGGGLQLLRRKDKRRIELQRMLVRRQLVSPSCKKPQQQRWGRGHIVVHFFIVIIVFLTLIAAASLVPGTCTRVA